MPWLFAASCCSNSPLLIFPPVGSSAGHLLSTAQVESALVEHEAVAEAAVVGRPHPIKGESLYCFVTLNEGVTYSRALEAELKKQGGWQGPTRRRVLSAFSLSCFFTLFKFTVREKIGAIATPDFIQSAPGLPKTRSGKVCRTFPPAVTGAGVSLNGDICRV